jgi:hypothetical protein
MTTQTQTVREAVCWKRLGNHEDTKAAKFL